MEPTASGGVSAKIRSARAAHAALVVGQSAILGISAALVVLAAAAAGGRPSVDAQATVAAVLTACLAAASWWMESIVGSREVANAIDRQEGLSGALLTAFESEASGLRSPVAELLSERVVPCVSVVRYVRTVVRSSALLLAVPFTAAAVLAYTLDSERDAPRGTPAAGGAAARSVSASADEVQRAAERLTTSAGIAPELAAESRRLAARAEDLGERARRADAASDEQVEEAKDLERAIAMLQDAVRTPGVAPSGPDGTMVGPDARARGGSEPSMPDPRADPAPDAPEPATPDPGSGKERGVGSPRWWSPRYDAVVERWLEIRRAGGERKPR